MRERQYENKVLEKALQVLEALGYPEYVEMSLEELSAALNINKGTLLPYLAVFERHQWLEQTTDRKWRVAPGLTRFAEGFRRHVAARRAEIARTEREHLGGEI